MLGPGVSGRRRSYPAAVGFVASTPLVAAAPLAAPLIIAVRASPPRRTSMPIVFSTAAAPLVNTRAACRRL